MALLLLWEKELLIGKNKCSETRNDIITQLNNLEEKINNFFFVLLLDWNSLSLTLQIITRRHTQNRQYYVRDLNKIYLFK